MQLATIFFLKSSPFFFWLPSFTLIWISFYFCPFNWYLFFHPASKWWTSETCPERNSSLSPSNLFLPIVFQIWGNGRGTHPLKPGVFLDTPSLSYLIHQHVLPIPTAQMILALSSALELLRWQWQIFFLASCTGSQNGSLLPLLPSSIHLEAL